MKTKTAKNTNEIKWFVNVEISENWCA